MAKTVYLTHDEARTFLAGGCCEGCLRPAGQWAQADRIGNVEAHGDYDTHGNLVGFLCPDCGGGRLPTWKQIVSLPDGREKIRLAAQWYGRFMRFRQHHECLLEVLDGAWKSIHLSDVGRLTRRAHLGMW